MKLLGKSNKEQNLIQKLNKKIKKVLPKNRYFHSVGVCYTAASIAMCYGQDVQSAMVAGILHDCAKSYSGMELLAMCDKYGVLPSEAERINPDLLHAKIGAVFAQKKYGIKNQDILDAISFHTTGRPDMSMLEKIIYIADYIEPARNKVKNLNEIRELAFKDIDKCILVIAENTISYIKEKDEYLDPVTESTLEFYKTKVEA